MKNISDEKEYKKNYGFNDKIKYKLKVEKGLSEEVIKKISLIKKEPEWMLKKRLDAYRIFKSKPIPDWGPDLKEINFNDIYYYISASDFKTNKWEEVPDEIKKTFEKLGVPEFERKFFAGVENQYDSEAIYSSIREDLKKQGIIFTDTDTALKKYPEIIKKYFGTVIPVNDNKFSSLNTAVWSGGSFLYVPKNVKLKMPLQAYFRINAKNLGQFERTLIIAEENSEVTYIEGCSAPIYSSFALHNGVVEIIANKNAHVKYITIQNWSKNVYNLVTQRAIAKEKSHVEWIDCNVGSKINMKYPCIYLKEKDAIGEILSVAIAKDGQIHDNGGKIFHLAPGTKSKIIAKNISIGNGNSTFRSTLFVSKNAKNVNAFQKCDSILIDNESKTNTFPYIKINANDANINHEASTGRINEENLFYLMSRGLNREDAIAIILLGFLDPLIKELPLEYSIELKRLLKLDTNNAIA
ncbi:MAG: Fe-S cluster assembly protein SufB [Candidatus Marsarchaeota archaeon]|nr:Fe-S cluster assembly protein SufB [Candidatus Marsarchaeota archaeon]MCL5094967.1 Fe-S cluster assembly protein SufB [Candidatus Marsarchaeota archaeon]